ncbi:LacI family DNA-binding transcriptional regulator [Fulvivirga ligni]|uniref:LacI family DNA-binding transcriptional regulator n=1 Tax=Fulvivirga ligni TaxID=2904246 RepID=UPI001F3060CC|nr:LacI family DNA-binding transcriptional regulator [Fulvivirga ligni]UII23327.1 LacI family transcriptional regulator [Fulvivirga ligni]
MKNKKGVTIYDIASELKVSPSTVSRALKDHYSISKEMIKEVKKLAQKRGYRPNSIAASLRSNKTNNIGVIISWINRPFISSLISGVEEEANKAGYNVIISQSHDSYENEVANARALYDSRISGLVVSLAMGTQNYDHFSQFIKNNIPVVFVDRVTDELNSDRVVIDNYAAGFNATKHLIEQGCKNIALVCGSQSRNIYRERESGYLAAMREHNMHINEDYIYHNDVLNAEEGFRIAEHLLSMDTPPDGIFTVNDTSAVSIIQYAKDKGIKIPDELAVIGFNNDPVSLIIDPQLSTVGHPAIEMGRLAAQQVLKQDKFKDVVKSETVMLRTELLVRASTLRKK